MTDKPSLSTSLTLIFVGAIVCGGLFVCISTAVSRFVCWIMVNLA